MMRRNLPVPFVRIPFYVTRVAMAGTTTTIRPPIRLTKLTVSSRVTIRATQPQPQPHTTLVRQVMGVRIVPIIGIQGITLTRTLIIRPTERISGLTGLKVARR